MEAGHWKWPALDTRRRDGRIYAATEIGVQVFDPTGRLCGVLTPARAAPRSAYAPEATRLAKARLGKEGEHAPSPGEGHGDAEASE